MKEIHKRIIIKHNHGEGWSADLYMNADIQTEGILRCTACVGFDIQGQKLNEDIGGALQEEYDITQASEAEKWYDRYVSLLQEDNSLKSAVDYRHYFDLGV